MTMSQWCSHVVAITIFLLCSMTFTPLWHNRSIPPRDENIQPRNPLGVYSIGLQIDLAYMSSIERLRHDGPPLSWNSLDQSCTSSSDGTLLWYCHLDQNKSAYNSFLP